MATLIKKTDNGDYTYDIVLEHQGIKVRCTCAGIYSSTIRDMGYGEFGINLDNLEADFQTIYRYATAGNDPHYSIV